MNRSLFAALVLVFASCRSVEAPASARECAEAFVSEMNGGDGEAAFRRVVRLPEVPEDFYLAGRQATLEKARDCASGKVRLEVVDFHQHAGGLSACVILRQCREGKARLLPVYLLGGRKGWGLAPGLSEIRGLVQHPKISVAEKQSLLDCELWQRERRRQLEAAP
ncbi:MAG: hypothetical protein RL095_1019 [Verrucomicrobiota bacterium]|jgi:hypothetical protein